MSLSYAEVKQQLDEEVAEDGGKFMPFDAAFYIKNFSNATAPAGYQGQFKTLSESGLTPLEHFVTYGSKVGFAPNSWFDADFYRAQYADVQALSAADLLVHFARFGVDEGRAPSNLFLQFDADAYFVRYPEVKQALIDNPELAEMFGADETGGVLTPGVLRNAAIGHWLKYGAAEGRVASTVSGTHFDNPYVSIPAQATIAMNADGAVVLDTNGGQTSLVKPATALDGAATDGVLRLVGDADVRIDLTNPNAVIREIDLNGDGVITRNGVENNVNIGKNFTIVDAYARNPLNEFDSTNNFFGDINFDGTGFDGDGVKTDGNIFLGGLGADTASGGIGNDFLAGGGVAASNGGFDRLEGDRNADFFFAELSALDRTDGNSLVIDGGNTSDDSSAGTKQTAQDSDWLLIEASDDDEPVQIWLNDDNTDVLTDTDALDGLYDNMGRVLSRSGESLAIDDIENVDASGNLYGFLNGLDIEMGGRRLDDRDEASEENYGLGSSAQFAIWGSKASNIIIAGYDNDYVDGGDGNDLLFGGNLQFLFETVAGGVTNPNLAGIVNDGRDELYGGAGNDNIVFEADGGVIDGGTGSDTLWLTNYSLGTKTASEMTTDGVLRFDLKSQTLADAAGYGGANVDGTQDQTNYVGAGRVTTTNMESVIATGLGGIDYKAAGSNSPELNFNNQQNFFGYEGNLDLRGSDGANTLYANTGNDKIEGRDGNDYLSGGDGADDFIFGTADGLASQASYGDGIDVIHRQKDIGNNLTDGTFIRDFGIGSITDTTSSFFRMTLTDKTDATELTVDTVDDKELDAYITAFDSITFTLDGESIEVDLTGLAALTYQNVADAVQQALDANPAFAGKVTAKVDPTDPNSILIEDEDGRDFGATADAKFTVKTPANTTWTAQPVDPDTTVTPDRLIYKSYEDRADNEGTDDDAVTGSTISLGVDSYAEDRVIHFGADGTRIAEDQRYELTFTNLTTEDVVTIKVNGVEYTLQVGVDLDGNSIAAEDGLNDTQPAIQAAFLARLRDFINSFMDDDTAAGEVSASLSGSTLTLTQATYNGEQTVFMVKPTVELQNRSGGEAASVVIVNNSDHELHLLDFDGRNNALNQDNVLFIGQENVNRAVLATAKTEGGELRGSEAVLVDGGANDLADIANNTATNASLATNFSVHGDDLLIGGAGNDTILGGTGDDRVHGSLGNDVLDGGKNYYAVKVLGEAEARVFVLNKWEAANFTKVAAIKALIDAGKTISSVTLINQTEDGSSLISGEFDDTLLFQQADFSANTKFTVVLDDFTVEGGVVQLKNDGAGRVLVDNGGDGTIDGETVFTNFENIRTVSGTGLAVAGKGQGNDTLDAVLLSAATGGILYNLTNDGEAGKVEYSADAHASATRPTEADFERLVLRVDGVENVITGIDGDALVSGDDLLRIDETEAAKNNTFTAGEGDDRIEYLHDFGSIPAEPKVTIKVNTAANQDQVVMTGGRLGTVEATDTLNSVEFITLANNTAGGTAEADVLDVTSMVTGAVVDYTNGQVRDLLGNVQVTIEGIAQMETVWADGNDTVIVADSAIMGGNLREDFDDGTAAGDITFSSFLDYDTLNATNKRVAFNAQTTAQITDVINQGQFTFDLSHVGTDADNDTVDYSNALDAIAVVVELDPARPNQYVLVDADGGTFDTGDLVNDNDRIDTLISVENIVASQGESVLDLTGSTKGLEIKFKTLDVANRNAALDRDVYFIQISDLSSAVPLTRNYVEYRDAGQLGGVTQAKATWNRIEGSDNAEVVILNSDHSFDNDTFNLRGGANQVKYNELTRSITTQLSVTDFDADNALTTGLITATTTFQDGNGGALLGGGTHVATAYTANNGIAAGSLRIAASQDAEDTLEVTGLDGKVFVLAEQGTTDNQITVKLGSGTAQNSVVLTGYEFLQDADSNDVYDMGSLSQVLAGLDLLDNAADHDAIQVRNDAVNFNGAGANTIGLTQINAVVGGFNFDFDVLDVTKVTASNLILNGVAAGEGTDEVVVGALAQISTISNFESMVLTQASVAAGTSFVFNPAANTLTQGSTTVSTSADVLSFGGLVYEGTLRDSYVADVTTGVTVKVEGATAATVHGGDGADTITGAGGADVLRGNGGDDVLDGGTSAEVRSFQLALPLDAAAGATITVDFNGGLTLTLNEVAAVADTNPADGDLDIAAGSTVDQVGAALVQLINANLAAVNALNLYQDTSGLVNVGITGVTYDAASDTISFTFQSGYDVDVADVITFADTDAQMLAGNAGSDLATTTEGSDGGSDTFVFEDTAANNGNDTINGFVVTLAGVSDDILDFTAFLGGSANYVGAGNFTAGAVLAAGDVAVLFNKATLAAADVQLAAAAGKIALADNGKAVVLVTEDADGAAGGLDVTNNPYKVYFIEDTDAGAGQSYSVTLVGTLNSTTELNAADFDAANFA